VFQRTANYSVPARNAPLTPEFKRWARGQFEEIRGIAQSTVNGHAFRIEERNVADVTPAERKAIYEAAWAQGGLQFRATFKDLLTDRAANTRLRNTSRDHAVEDPDMPPRSPTSITRTRRSGHDRRFFETNRPNVSLVDLRADPIERITPANLGPAAAASARHHRVRHGFRCAYRALNRHRARSLRDDWKAGPESYLGLQVPGYPNFFTITGPGSPSVLTNMPVAIEQHVEWTTDCIGTAQAGLASGAVRSDAQWGAQVEEPRRQRCCGTRSLVVLRRQCGG
jgi:cation diffusion facilitator CzcD-associated flavoprotein CzcO